MAYKLQIENNVQLPAILWQEDLVSGFTDVTNNMMYWDKYANQIVASNIIQKNIINLVIAIAGEDYSNWNNLTAEQKIIACKWFAVSYNLRVPDVITEEEDKKRWYYLVPILEGNDFDYKNGRTKTFLEMWKVVSNYVRKDILSCEHSKQFFKDVQDFVNWYIYSANESLIWWINNTPGTPYENDGFAQAEYFSEDIRDDVTYIYNGNFNLK